MGVSFERLPQESLTCQMVFTQTGGCPYGFLVPRCQLGQVLFQGEMIQGSQLA